MDERIPQTQPSGALVPPPRVPPVALATSAPLPPRPVHGRPARRRGLGAEIGLGLLVGLGVLSDVALDGLDELGERIAHAAGLR